MQEELNSSQQKGQVLRTFLLFSVPGICYTVCNILPYFILEHMNVITYVMAAVLKIPVTACLMRIILKKSLASSQWFALAMLSSGSVLSVIDTNRGYQYQHANFGDAAFHLIFVSILLSSFAAVWSEFLLKKTQQSIHAQNMQLYFHGILANSVAMMVFRRHRNSFGRTPTISDLPALLSVFTLVGVGLLTSVVMKHADNIIRLFLTGSSLSLAQILASSLFGESFTFQQVAGLLMTLLAFLLYDYFGTQKQ